MCRYDEGEKGFLDMSDLRSVLHDVGLLEGVRNRDQYVAAQLQMADKTHSGTLSLDEFSLYYSSLVLAGVLLARYLLCV
jgi:Ca2+-binding EF-hand superfamily protein